MTLNIIALDGDGISTEILEATLAVLAACDTGLRIARAEVGFRALEKYGTTLPDAVLNRARDADGLILGPVSHMDYPPVEQGGVNPSGLLRKTLDLYANIRPAKSFAGVETPTGQAMDLVTVRENTEGFYADRTMVQGSGEFMPNSDLALAVRKISRGCSRRIAERAFELAQQRGLGLCAIHKANVLRMSDGLFLEEVRRTSRQFPTVAYEELLVDAAAALLVRTPSRFGVLVTTNMFGDILSDLAAELAGGLGLAGSLNQGDTHAMAQAQHGSAPTLANQNLANPTSLIFSAVQLLWWLSHQHNRPELAQAAQRIEQAVAFCLSRPQTRTTDLGGVLGTREFTEGVIAKLREN